MNKNNILITLSLILIIFFIGFFLRLETAQMYGLNETAKQSFTDDNGLPYMIEMDSYYHYRLTENLLNNGHFGDEIKNGVSWDNHSYYPPGREVNYPPVIIWVTAIAYFLINIFANISLLNVAYWLPIFIAPLSGIVGYFLVRKYAGDAGGFVAGILIVTAPMYFFRTSPGFFDTDMFCFLFPLMAILFFSDAIECHNIRTSLIYVILAAISLTLFALAWTGWMYIIYIFMVSGIIYLFAAKFIGKVKSSQLKKFSGIFLLFILLSLILIVLSSGLQGIISIIEQPLSYLPFFSGDASIGEWPNIYESVKELRQPALKEFVSDAGPLNLGLGILGIFAIVSVMLRSSMRSKYLPKLNWFMFVLFFTWILVALIAFSTSVRFAMLLIPPLAVFSGILVAILLGYINNSEFISARKNLSMILSVLLVVIILIPPLANTVDNVMNTVPGVDDDLWDASLWIKSHTSPDTVIISQWSYGHMFAAIADRPVIFDGGSQNSPRAYWINRAFSTSNETLSAGIMRMLSSSGDDAYLTLNNYTGETATSAKILNNILGVSKEEARTILIDQYGLYPNQVDNILNYTHPDNPRPFVVVTYDDMLTEGYWVFRFGNWDFDNLKAGDYSYSRGNTSDKGSIKKYSNGVILNLENKSASLNNETPSDIILYDGATTETYNLNNNSNLSFIFNLNNGMVVVMDKKFENSVFTNLVVFKRSSNVFKPLYKINSVVIWTSV